MGQRLVGAHYSGARTIRLAQLPGQAEVARSVAQLLSMSLRALPEMYISEECSFVQTVRPDAAAEHGLRRYGRNLRYGAIVALGAAHIDVSDQRAMLAGNTVQELVTPLIPRGVSAPD